MFWLQSGRPLFRDPKRRQAAFLKIASPDHHQVRISDVVHRRNLAARKLFAILVGHERNDEGHERYCDKMSSMRMTGNPDVDFASMMREHHKCAPAMAEAQPKNGKDAGMRDLAKNILASQKKEIAQFDAFLAKNGDAKARQEADPAAGKAGASASAPAVFADGEVRKVDKEAKKITLKHGEIKNLDMLGMTMAFPVKDATMLDKLKVGDKVQFKVVDDGGTLIVIEIQAAK